MTRTRLLLIAALVLPAVLPAQDPVRSWNATALDTIRTANISPPVASRLLAMLHVAVFDAVNGVQPRYDVYLVPPKVPPFASREAAAITAAHDVMTSLQPTFAQRFAAQRDTELAAIAPSPARSAGIAWGTDVARAILAARANDGSSGAATYPGSTEPGKWRPTLSFGGIVRPALVPHWGRVRPFALRTGTQYRPPPPPSLRSLRYAAEVFTVQRLGARDGSTRTPEQTEIARFWGYGPGTATPPGHWNQIATAALASEPVDRHDLVDVARIYALMNVAMADAAIACWDCKYDIGLWRPITAIQLADQDRNALTIADRSWMPLLETPPFPEYTSGHSTFSAAAAVALILGFGRDAVPFRVGSDDLPGVERRYARFSEAAIESGISRVYGGIHFWSGNVEGLESGLRIGLWTVSNVLRPRRR